MARPALCAALLVRVMLLAAQQASAQYNEQQTSTNPTLATSVSATTAGELGLFLGPNGTFLIRDQENVVSDVTTFLAQSVRCSGQWCLDLTAALKSTPALPDINAKVLLWAPKVAGTQAGTDYDPRGKDWASVASTCRALFKYEKRLANFVIRAAFHDSLSVDVSKCPGPLCGGADSSLLLTIEEMLRPENAYDSFSERSARAMKKIASFYDTSVADAMAICAAVAPEVLSNGRVKIIADDLPDAMRVGRLDSLTPTPPNQLPANDADPTAFMAFWSARGFTEAEAVALMGSHALVDDQGCFQGPKPSDYCQDPASPDCSPRMFKWENHYYRDICSPELTVKLAPTDRLEPAETPILGMTEVEMEAEVRTEACKFTSPEFRQAAINELSLAQTGQAVDPDAAEPRNKYDIYWDNRNCMTGRAWGLNTSASCPHPNTWFYTVNDAFLGQVCQGNAFTPSTVKMRDAARAFLDQAAWDAAFRSAYIKMLTVFATFAPKASTQPVMVRGNECPSGTTLDPTCAQAEPGAPVQGTVALWNGCPTCRNTACTSCCSCVNAVAGSLGGSNPLITCSRCCVCSTAFREYSINFTASRVERVPSSARFPGLLPSFTMPEVPLPTAPEAEVPETPTADIVEEEEPTNIALERPAYSSSSLQFADCPFSNCTANLAVDGVTNIARAFLHTLSGTEDPAQWLSIDLGVGARVHEVVLYHRTDCCVERMRNAEIRVGDTPVRTPADWVSIASNALVWKQPSTTVYPTGAVTRIKLTEPAVGRWMTLQNMNDFLPASNTALQLLEIQVLGFVPENLALGKPAFASSQYPGFCNGNCGPSFLVDGETDNDRAMLHTRFANEDPTQWLSIDLGDSATIDEVVIYHRTSGADRTRNAEIRIGETPVRTAADTAAITANPLVWKQPADVVYANGAVTRIKLANPAQGRWLTLQNKNTFLPAGNVALQVMEVQVYGTVQDNLALNKQAYASSSHIGFCSEFNCGPKWAVDGVTNYIYRILHTASGDTAQWLSIDLGSDSIVDEVYIYHRADCCADRTRNAEIRIGYAPVTSAADAATNLLANPLVWKQAADVVYANGAVTRIKLADPAHGRWLTLQNKNTFLPASNTALQVMEVQVYGTVQVNLALSKPAYASSSLNWFCTGNNCGPNFAVDGVTDSIHGISHTAFGDPAQWLSIDLGSESIVDEVHIFHRVDCCTERTRSAEIRIGNAPVTSAADAATNLLANPLVWKQAADVVYANGAVTRIKLANPAKGRWLTLQNKNTAGGVALQVTEIKVYGTDLAVDITRGTGALADPPITPYANPASVCPSQHGTSVRVSGYPSSPFRWNPFTRSFARPPPAQKANSYCKDVGNGNNYCVDAYEIDIVPTTVDLGCPVGRTRVLSYNGTVPGPTFRVLKGRQTLVRFNNRLTSSNLGGFSAHMPCDTTGGRQGRPISVHLHGEASLAPYDGWAEDTTCGGESKDYYFSNRRPALAWYHDHALEITSDNAYAGLSGMYMVHDRAAEGGCGEPWNLDALPDTEMQFKDAVLDSQCQLLYDRQGRHKNNIYGDMNLVNGIPWPVMTIEPRWQRFRWLNAAVSRPYKLRLVDDKGIDVSGSMCKVIMGEGGIRRTPAQFPASGLFMGVAERYEVACDFTNLAGRTLYLWNAQDRDRMKDVPFFCNSHLVMKIVVQGCAGSAGTCAPANSELRADVPARPTLDAVLTQADVDTALAMVSTKTCTRTFKFGRRRGQWVINGETWHSARIAAGDVGQNTWEVWCLETGGGWFHPIHIHLVDFYIIARNGDPGNVHSYEQWTAKDVVQLDPSSSVTLLLRFGPHRGEYMFHCHNLVHEDTEMMRSFSIIKTEQGKTSSTALALQKQSALETSNNVLYDLYNNPTNARWGPQTTERLVPLRNPGAAAAVSFPVDNRIYRIFYPAGSSTAGESELLLNKSINPWIVETCQTQRP